MLWIFATLAVLAGALVPIQAGANATLRNAVGSPIFAAIVNFTIGGLLLLLYALGSRMEWPTGAMLGKIPLWCFVGGAVGACWVLAGVLFAHRLGAAAFVACIIVGQLTASVALDHFGWIGFQQHAVNGMRVLGVGLLGLGAYLIRTH